MEYNEQVIYVCSKCSAPLEEDTMHSHPCLKGLSLLPTITVAESTELNDYIQEEPEVEEYLIQRTVERRKGPNKRRRGDWTDEDVFRLIDVYIKNYKALPKQAGFGSKYLWDRIMRELNTDGNFSRFLVQAKMKKLKTACQALLQENQTDTNWPYFEKMCQLLEVEAEVDSNATEPAYEEQVTAETDAENESDDTSEEVKGLRRWTITETRHLIDVYKKHLRPENFTASQCNKRKIAWENIIADLKYDLPQRFTTYQIRAKMRNIQHMYKAVSGVVVDKTKKRVRWPLFRDMAELAKLERSLAEETNSTVSANWTGDVDPAIVLASVPPSQDIDSDDETTPESKNIRWNPEQTQALLDNYHINLNDLIFIESEVERDEIWNVITVNVNKLRSQKVSVKQVKNKMNLLRSLYKKRNYKALYPLFEKAEEIFEAERCLRNEGESVRTTEKRRRNESESDKEEEPPRKRYDSSLTWHEILQLDSKRRHEEKIAIQKKIISVLEKIVSRMTY